MIKIYIMPHLEDYMTYYQSLYGVESQLTTTYTNEKSKMESISTEVLLNYALFDTYQTKLSFPIETSKNGKPVLINETGIHFNKSHSKKYGLVVISTHEIGCDIEYIKSDFKLIPNVLTAKELQVYEAAHERTKPNIFYKYWTAKESFLKLQGIGITKKLSNYHYEFINDHEGFIENNYIHQFIIDMHLVAIATKYKQEIEVYHVDKNLIDKFLISIKSL